MNAKRTDTEDGAFYRARRSLLLDHCFFGSLIMHLNAIEDSDAKRGVWADGKRIGFNAASMEEIVDKSLSAGAGLLAKSVLQCALGHHVRRDNRRADLWQKASDAVVNPEVISTGLELPAGAFFDERLKGKSVEQAYAILEAEAMQQEDEQKKQQQEGDGKEQEGEGDEGEGDGSSESKGKGKPQQGKGSADAEGSGEGEDDGEPQPQTGEVRDLPGEDEGSAAGEAEREDQAREWKITLQQALQSAQSRGDLPGSLRAMIEQALAPQVRWQDELRKWMQSRSFDESSWSVPNRRFMSLGITLPTVRSQRMGDMVIGNDTSGSTAGAQAAFKGEMQAIIEDVNPKRTLYLQCDTRIVAEHELEPGDEFPTEVKGFGGTDLRKLFERVDEEQIEPACMIVLTDLQTPFPSVEPAYPVLWVSVCAGVAPFGDVIYIDPSQR